MTVPHGDGTRTFGLAGLVDLERFPIIERSAPSYAEAVASARRGLRSVGCAVLESFVRPEAVEVLNDETLERKHATHCSTQIINPYFHTTVDPAYPADHVVNTFVERTSGFIPGDACDPGCATDISAPSPSVTRQRRRSWRGATLSTGPPRATRQRRRSWRGATLSTGPPRATQASTSRAC